MPIYEVSCKNDACANRGVLREVLAKRFDDLMPECELCHERLLKIPSICHGIWLGTLDKYLARGEAMVNARDGGGHLVYRTRSSRMVDGSPEPVVIRTRQEQKEYCRAEGLTMPDDMPQHVEWDAKSASSQGLPGCWASVNTAFMEAERAKPLPPDLRPRRP